ncbi:hypothetical protein ACFQ6S_06365 [Streptomyces sp. NPDC056479]
MSIRTHDSRLRRGTVDGWLKKRNAAAYVSLWGCAWVWALSNWPFFGLI